MEKVTNWERSVTLKGAVSVRCDIWSLEKEHKKDLEQLNELSNKNKHYEHERVI